METKTLKTVNENINIEIRTSPPDPKKGLVGDTEIRVGPLRIAVWSHMDKIEVRQHQIPEKEFEKIDLPPVDLKTTTLKRVYLADAHYAFFKKW